MTVQRLAQSDAGMSGFALSSFLFQRRRLGTVVCLLMLAAASWVGGQTVNTTLQGRVLDTTGASIPGATVTATNSATGLTRSVTASALGEYQIEGLPAGDYTLVVRDGSSNGREIGRYPFKIQY